MLEEATDHVLVDNLAVAPQAQGRGVGGRLLEHADQRARAAGLPEVRLHAHELMTENLAHYPRQGFREPHRQIEDRRTRVFISRAVLPAGPGQRGDPGTVGGGP